MSTTLVFLVIFVSLQGVRSDDKSHNYYFSNVATNQIVKSEHYPAPYPRDMNVTWKWEVQSGLWGIVFEDFDLDSDHDCLEILEGNGKHLRYRDTNKPVLEYPYKTGGPVLIIRFITDEKTELNTRGFKLQVFYGKDEPELDLKIHDAGKDKPKEEEKEASNLLLVIIAAALILLIIVVVSGGYCFWRRRKLDQHNENRNAFGIRRGSGISHSRRERPADGGPPNNDQHQRQPLQQQPHRPERPVQRSDSQLTWIARAELTTTIQTAGQSPNPNIYTVTDDTKEKTVKTARESTNQRFGATTSCGSLTRRGTSSDQRGNNATDGARRLENMNTPVSNSSRVGSSTSQASGSQALCSPTTTDNINLSPTSPGAIDRTSTGEYIDTVDSLNVKRDTQDGWQDEEPPSYRDSQLIPPPPPYETKDSANSVTCYENVLFYGNNDSCPGNRCTGSQTNIYINASGLAYCSNGSLSRITIDTASSSTLATRSSNEEGKNLSQGKMATGSQDETDIRLSRSPRTSKKSPKTPTSSSSAVQIVDGYAYLVPPSTEESTKQDGRDVASSRDIKPQQSVTNKTSFHLDIVPSVPRSSAQDIAKGYVDIPRNIPVDAAKVYVNVEK